MSASPSRQNTRIGFWSLLPIPLAVAAFIWGAPWLREVTGDTVMSVIVAVAAIVMMAYANYLAIRHQRGMDEVEKFSAGFAMQWGVPAGQALFVVLALLPPVQNLAVTAISAGAGIAADPKVVLMAMMLGFGALVLLQTLCMAVVNTVWWLRTR